MGALLENTEMTTTEKTAEDYSTTYSDGACVYPAYLIRWDDARDIVGRTLRAGDGKDMATLIRWLCSHGPKSYLALTSGWIDEHGVGFYDPRQGNPL